MCIYFHLCWLIYIIYYLIIVISLGLSYLSVVQLAGMDTPTPAVRPIGALPELPAAINLEDAAAEGYECESGARTGSTGITARIKTLRAR